MANVVKEKTVKCIEWYLHTSRVGSTHLSRPFYIQIQGRLCGFAFEVGHYDSGTASYINCLYFISNKELPSPIAVSVRGAISSTVLLIQASGSIKGVREPIWNCNTHNLAFKELTFDVAIFGDYPICDKSVQTPSYIDNNYLLEGISQDVEKLLNEESNHDVEFICGEQTIKAHKNVLSCRSDVLAAMLHGEMIEGQTGRVIIQDMDATLFKQFRNCLYTGILPNLIVDTAVRFYEAGDKYNVASLKRQCADFLIDHLCPDNAYEILILADRHNDPEFKKGIIEYLIKEKIPCMGKKWTRFCDNNLKLANEVLALFCQHLQNKSKILS